MNKFLMIVLSLMVFCGFTKVQAQKGFVLWAEGGDCSRTLTFNKIEDGKVGEKQVAVEKHIADCWVHVSYDGVWIAFCRVDQAFKGRYGQCDYHSFDKWDIYVAKIDNGKTLPATPIKVDHGYFPSWAMDENAKDPSKPKLLYYSRFKDGTIRKAVINADGTVASKDEIHATCPKVMGGTNAHTQGSPDGKFILYRPKGMSLHSLELKKDINEKDLGGCHPCWGPRSKYFVRSQNGAFLNTGTSVTSLGKAGVGQYWQGLSNDAYYDEGKLWVIGRMGGKGSRNQTSSERIAFTEVDISNDGWKLGKATDVGSGTSCDIHFWPGGADGPPVKISFSPLNKLDNGVNFSARVSAGPVGLQLIIESVEPAYSAGLYNLQGAQKAFIGNSDKYQTVIPLNGVSDGTYMLKLETDKGTGQKTIRIAR